MLRHAAAQYESRAKARTAPTPLQLGRVAAVWVVVAIATVVGVGVCFSVIGAPSWLSACLGGLAGLRVAAAGAGHRSDPRQQ
jgi:hypothetical protein